MNKNPIKICEDIIDNNKYDYEAKSYHFEIKYENKLIIDLVHTYETYDKNKKIKHKQKYERIDEINMTLQEYCNFLISFYEFKLHLGEWSMPKERAYRKIHIRR